MRIWAPFTDLLWCLLYGWDEEAFSDSRLNNKESHIYVYGKRYPFRSFHIHHYRREERMSRKLALLIYPAVATSYNLLLSAMAILRVVITEGLFDRRA